MPCRYEETPEEIAAAAKLSKEKTVGPLKKRVAALEKQRDELTQLLCAACQELDAVIDGRIVVTIFDKYPALRVWWVDHLKKDAALKAKEKKSGSSLPLRLRRASDAEIFSLNKDGTTYSIETMKQQFPKKLHSTYSLAALVNSGGFYIMP